MFYDPIPETRNPIDMLDRQKFCRPSPDKLPAMAFVKKYAEQAH
jgi:hypothetical protein